MRIGHWGVVVKKNLNICKVYLYLVARMHTKIINFINFEMNLL